MVTELMGGGDVEGFIEPPTTGRAHLFASTSLVSAVGDVKAARLHVAQMVATAERLRDRILLPRSLGAEVQHSCLNG